jgi:predicted transcriptional regulator
MRKLLRHDKISVNVTAGRVDDHLLERLEVIGQREDRSINFLVLAAIAEYLERHEVKAE